MRRVAVLNGFGISLGDGVIGLQALSVAQRLGVVGECVLVRGSCGLVLDQLYALAGFASVADCSAAADRVIDIRDFAFDPSFRGRAMIDFFLERLGILPGNVPGAWKRNSWLAPLVSPVPPSLPDRYVLVCPRSSMALRDMPGFVHDMVLQRLVSAGCAVATQGAPAAGTIAVPPMAGLAELCGLVAHAAAIVSTDTAMVHLADAFDVPCLALFTTHRPEWRMRDYPLCEPVYLPPALPPALEFSRGPEDLAAMGRAWRRNTETIAERVTSFAQKIQPPTR